MKAKPRFVLCRGPICGPQTTSGERSPVLSEQIFGGPNSVIRGPLDIFGKKVTIQGASGNPVAPSEPNTLRQWEAEVVHRYPQKMKVGDRQTVSVVVGTKGIQLLEIIGKLPESYADRRSTIRPKKIVSAKLFGSDFKIVPQAEEKQAAEPDQAALWQWEIEALKAGPARLHLVMYTEDDKERIARSLPAKVIEISVEVAPPKPLITRAAAFFEKLFEPDFFWDKLGLPIATFLGGGLVAWVSSRRRKSADPVRIEGW